MTLALVLDGSGFSRRCEIFPGNVSEPTTLKKMIEQMRTPIDPDQQQGSTELSQFDQKALDLRPTPTIVMDAGLASEANIQWLQEQGYKYIVVSRKRQRTFDEEAPSVLVKEQGDNIVRAQRVQKENDEVELYCHSTARGAKEKAMQQAVNQRFEKELDHLASGLKLPRRLKKADKVHQKIGRLRQKYSRASGHYKIDVETDVKGEFVTALHYQRESNKQDSTAQLGVYCLRSNQLDWDENQLWSTYTRLTDLEAVFRSLKSELGMRPVYHQKTHRVEGHIFITLLAYNLVHQIRCRLKAQGINDSWDKIRATMSTQMRITTSLRDEHDRQIHVRKSTRPNAQQKKLLNALNLPCLLGRTEKTVMGV